MKRFKVLFGNRRMVVLLTLAILVLAATALVASSASFTASSANLSNTFTTGNLTMSGDSISIATGKLMPGHSLTGAINVTATSDGGTASLYIKRTLLTDSTPAGLASKLTLAITGASYSSNGGSTWTAIAGFTPYAATALNDAGAISGPVASPNGYKLTTVPDLTPGRMYRFDVAVNFPDGGVGGDNSLKGLNCTPTYVLTAISD
jgi:hypothetical protein